MFTERERSKVKWRIEPLMGGLALLVLLVGCYLTLRPFFSGLMWAVILSYLLYPLQRRFTVWFRGSQTLAAICVALTVVLVMAGPVFLIGMRLAEDGKSMGMATRDKIMAAPDEAPAWVVRVPVFGDDLATYWEDFSEGKRDWMAQLERAASGNGGVRPELDEVELEVEESRLTALLGKSLAGIRDGLVRTGVALGHGVLEVVVSAFLAFFLLRDAPVLGARLAVAVGRLAGERGQHLLQVARGTVKGVIYGVLGTALVQAVVGGIGFAIAGVPGAILLGVLTFFFAVIPFGPVLLWGPAAIWLFMQGSPGWGVFMLIWGGLGISSVDNVLRPLLISHGTKMPFALIFCGLIGGAMAFGLVGIFIGPILLAVAYRIVDEWTIMEDFQPLNDGTEH